MIGHRWALGPMIYDAHTWAVSPVMGAASGAGPGVLWGWRWERVMLGDVVWYGMGGQGELGGGSCIMKGKGSNYDLIG